MKMKGSKIILECLIKNNVDTVFGYPGGSVLELYDALYFYEDKIRHYLTSHEQGACHCADGYARFSGKTGVVIATSGPGATNLITGIATAYMDSIPLVVITGNVQMSLLGQDSFQEVDTAGITAPITKHNYIVKNINDLEGIINQAFLIASSGRKGPVLVDVPKNIFVEECDYLGGELIVSCLKTPLSLEQKEKLKQVTKLIDESKKPLLYFGGGVKSALASEIAVELGEKLKCPMATTLMGIGVVPSSHRQNLGFLGMHGSETANKTAFECDLLVAFGTRFSDRVVTKVKQFAKNARIVHIDIDNAEINKNVMPDIGVKLDAFVALSELNKLVKPREESEWLKSVVYKKATECCEKTRVVLENPKENLAEIVLQNISNHKDKYLAIATDVGQHQMWTAKNVEISAPNKFLTSGGLGTMGFGLGAAIGASVFHKGKTVLVTGDGSFHMNFNELATCQKYDVDISIFIMNNSSLGMVKQWQRLFYDKRYSSTQLTQKTNYEFLAKAFGAKYYKIENQIDSETVVCKALSEKGVIIVEVEVWNDANVLPMLPPGAGYEKIITKITENSEVKQ